MTFFTADLHLFHESTITKFIFRPFKSVDEMNFEILKRWNNVVKENDNVYILGDVTFNWNNGCVDILKNMKGKKYLILGNHDKLNQEQAKLFIWAKDYYRLRYENYRFILFHYPIISWDGKEKGSIHLHGHVHNNAHDDVEIKNKINVGVDLWDYTPVPINEILKRIER